METMTKAVRLSRTGGPEVLTVETVERGAPGPSEVWIEQEAVGVNYLDAMQRAGAAPIPLPSGLGLEAAGRVAAIGSEVEGVAVGDHVAYALGPIGAYASGRLYPAERLLKLPAGVGSEAAASILFKGLTAQYLLKTTGHVGAGTVVLLYGVGGGLGQVMTPWAKHLGAFVIGVVSKAASVERARMLGCDAVLIWGACDLPTEVAALTGGRKADVVYDGVGRDTLEASLDSLRPRGLLASIGASSGPPAPIELATLNAKGSLFATRASLAAHITDLAEYRERAADVFAAAKAGVFATSIWRSFPLAEAAAAHVALESRTHAGPLVLKP
jgi:NADPH2:quinone reductase